MFDRPAREAPWLSWLYVLIGSLVIFVSIPFAPTIVRFMYRQWGREVFTYVVLSAILIALVASIVYLRRCRTDSRSHYFWLLAVAVIFSGYTLELGKRTPAEAIHFIQYGILGILVYRALTHRISDISIYLSAAVICGIIGIIDEVIQWIIPGRYWNLGDIWINVFSAGLVQVSIAKGLKPTFIATRARPANLRFLCRLAIVGIGLLAANLLNTPARIAWYADRIPRLAFLKNNESLMLEYGYLYEDPDIGIFRSRFSSRELERNDRERSVEAAGILDRFQDGPAYGAFLKIYTPMVDPFVHEARVHLFSRDHHFLRSKKFRGDPKNYAELLTVALRENQIMEKYFSNTLHRSSYVWSADALAVARNHFVRDQAVDSQVSRNLITLVSEVQVAGFFVLLIVGLVLLHGFLGRYRSTGFFG